MQRILSLAALAALGGFAWLFLQKGGLDRFAPSSPGGGQSSGERTINAAAPGSTIRIASFHIDAFNKDKFDALNKDEAAKRAVMHSLADVIRRFDIVAIQGIQSDDDYLMINFVRMINESGRRYNHLVGERIGNTAPREQLAFVFDEQRVGLDFNSYYTLGDPENLLNYEPLVASFYTRGVPANQVFTFTLVNVRTAERVREIELDVLADAYREIRRVGGNEDDVIMLGSFYADGKSLGRLGKIPDVAALIQNSATNVGKTQALDNVVIHQPSTAEYRGRSGVFDTMREFNITLAQAEQISRHMPVWAEFTVYELDYSGRVATRPTTTLR